MAPPPIANLKILVDEGDLSAKIRQRPDVLVLDTSSIGERLRKLSETDPYFARKNVVSFVVGVSARLADRMARLFSRTWGASADMISDAIHFHLLTELCTIIPLRRLARSIARENEQKRICVILSNLDVPCLGQWRPNELEPLILCWALQKRGCKAYLLCRKKLIGPRITLNLRPSPLALPPRGPDLDPKTIPQRSPIVAWEGMRGLHLIGKEVKNPIFFAGSILLVELPTGPTFFTLGPGNLAPEIPVKFRRDQSELVPFSQFAAPWPPDPLSFYFDRILGPPFPFMVQRIRALIRTADIKNAFVCDHHFFGSGILAHAVKEHGGRVTLWPHSANPWLREIRMRNNFDDIIVMTHAAAKLWKQRFPDKTVRLRPQIMLPPQQQPKRFDPSAPLAVVVFGGAHFLGRLPLCRLESHIRSYRRFLSHPTAGSKFVRLLFKPKEWETEHWLRDEVLGTAQSVEITNKIPTELDYPNMIFVSITFGSTALMEGFARAIPGLIVREQNIEDYTTLTADVVPTGNVEFAWDIISRCHDADYYARLLQTQIEYLARQTRQGQDGLSSTRSGSLARP